MSSFNFAENIVAADIPGLHAGATVQTGLATDTAGVGAQTHAAGLTVRPLGCDPFSAQIAAHIMTCASQYATQLGSAADMQNIYGEVISSAGNTYSAADAAAAAGLATAAPTGSV